MDGGGFLKSWKLCEGVFGCGCGCGCGCVELVVMLVQRKPSPRSAILPPLLLIPACQFPSIICDGEAATCY